MIKVQEIINWIREQVKESSAKGIVFGLSGGLDSTVIAYLCKSAVGENLIGLILPCHSSKNDIEDAKFIAKKFDIKTIFIDLSDIHNEFLKILPKGNKISHANLKSRLRMTTLYYFANKLNYLVVGSGNKSELSIGYFTKYGDGGVDILPIGDLLKTDVQNLAEQIGVPQRIIKKKPSAGLWKGQTNEGEIGITYSELDKILKAIEKKNIKKFPKYKSNKIKNLIKISSHKREIPRIFKIDN